MGFGRTSEAAAPTVDKPVVRAPAPASGGAGAGATGLLQLQRLAGNAAVLRRVESEGAESESETPTPPPAAPPPPQTPKPFDHESAQKDLQELAHRLERFPAIAKTDFLPLMQAYVQAAGESRWEDAKTNMLKAIHRLDEQRAFTIGNAVYAKLGDDPDPAELDRLADEAMSNVYLWSKLNKHKAIDTVKGGERGNSLEASAAGSLFDGLSFGMDYGSHAVLRDQWKHVSESFVTKARGVVHAQILEGVDPGSVLTTTEWPKIRKMIEEKIVLAFVIHIFRYQGVEKSSAPKDFTEVEQRKVLTQEDWDALPKVPAEGAELDGYKERQKEAHFGEEARHERESQTPTLLKEHRETFKKSKAFWEDLAARKSG